LARRSRTQAFITTSNAVEPFAPDSEVITAADKPGRTGATKICSDAAGAQRYGIPPLSVHLLRKHSSGKRGEIRRSSESIFYHMKPPPIGDAIVINDGNHRIAGASNRGILRNTKSAGSQPHIIDWHSITATLLHDSL
jgi:hypothetical protein